MSEKIKLIEQERDALRTIAKNEEIARIAAEGRLPLPSLPADDEFASPKKGRKSLDPVSITSSAASEEELEEIRMLLQWERHNAKRAHDLVEFLELECRLKCCASRASRSTSQVEATPMPTISNNNCDVSPEKVGTAQPSHVFIPAEGVFRAVTPAAEESPWISPAKKAAPFNQEIQITPFESEEPSHPGIDLRPYARTPSCEPPAPAMMHDVSLLSLLDAPQTPVDSRPNSSSSKENQSVKETQNSKENQNPMEDPNASPPNKPNLVATFHTISTTTRIPLSNPPDLTPAPRQDLKLTSTNLDFANNPALSPTMTREEALAQIRERRGRARSLAQGTLTPRKQMVNGVGERRDISAPAMRSGGARGRR